MIARTLPRLRHDERGATLIEFAFASPVLIAALLGAVHIGQALHASAAMRHALDEGARSLRLDDSPTADEVRDDVEASYAGIDKSKARFSVAEKGVVGGATYWDLKLIYSLDPDIAFIDLPKITMTKTRRVFLAD
jgi:Flp pilus assembly protein TadG